MIDWHKTSNDAFALCLTDTPSSEVFPTELKRVRKCSWNQLENHYVLFVDVFSKGYIVKSFKINRVALSYLDTMWFKLRRALEVASASAVHNNVASS